MSIYNVIMAPEGSFPLGWIFVLREVLGMYLYVIESGHPLNTFARKTIHDSPLDSIYKIRSSYIYKIYGRYQQLFIFSLIFPYITSNM